MKIWFEEGYSDVEQALASKKDEERKTKNKNKEDNINAENTHVKKSDNTLASKDATNSKQHASTITDEQARLLAKHGVNFIEVQEAGYSPALASSTKRQHQFAQTTYSGEQANRIEQRTALQSAISGEDYATSEQRVVQKTEKEAQKAKIRDAYHRAQKILDKYLAEAKHIYDIPAGQKLAEQAYKTIYNILAKAGMKAAARTWANSAKNQIIETVMNNVTRKNKALDAISRLYNKYVSNPDAESAEHFRDEASRIAQEYGVAGLPDVQNEIKNLSRAIQAAYEKKRRKEYEENARAIYIDVTTAFSNMRNFSGDPDTVAKKAYEDALKRMLDAGIPRDIAERYARKVQEDVRRNLSITLQNIANAKKQLATLYEKYRNIIQNNPSDEVLGRFAKDAQEVLNKYGVSGVQDLVMVLHEYQNMLRKEIEQVRQSQASVDAATASLRRKEAKTGKELPDNIRNLYSRFMNSLDMLERRLRTLSQKPANELTIMKNTLAQYAIQLRTLAPDIFTNSIPATYRDDVHVRDMVKTLTQKYQHVKSLLDELLKRANAVVEIDRYYVALAGLREKLYRVGAKMIALANSGHMSRETWDALRDKYTQLQHRLEQLSHRRDEQSLAQFAAEVEEFAALVDKAYQEAGRPEAKNLSTLEGLLRQRAEPEAVLSAKTLARLAAEGLTPGHVISDINKRIDESSLPDWLKPVARVAGMVGTGVVYSAGGVVGLALGAYDVARTVINTVRDPIMRSSISSLVNRMKAACSSGDPKACASTAEPILETIAALVVAHYGGKVLDAATASTLEKVAAGMRRLGRNDLASKIERVLQESRQAKTLEVTSTIRTPEAVKFDVSELPDGSIVVKYAAKGTVSSRTTLVRLPPDLADQLVLALGDKTLALDIVKRAAKLGKIEQLESILSKLKRLPSNVRSVLLAKIRGQLSSLNLDNVESILEKTLQDVTKDTHLKISTTEPKKLLSAKNIYVDEVSDKVLAYHMDTQSGQIRVRIAPAEVGPHTATIDLDGRTIVVHYTVEGGRVKINGVEGASLGELKKLLGDEMKFIELVLKEGAKDKISGASYGEKVVAITTRYKPFRYVVEVNGEEIPISAKVDLDNGYVLIENKAEFVSKLKSMGLRDDEIANVLSKIEEQIGRNPYEGELYIKTRNRALAVEYAGEEVTAIRPGTHQVVVQVGNDHIGIVYTLEKHGSKLSVGDVRLIGIDEAAFMKKFGMRPRQWLEGLIEVAEKNQTDLDVLIRERLRGLNLDMENTAAVTLAGRDKSYTASAGSAHTSEQATIYGGRQYVTVGKMTIYIDDPQVRAQLVEALRKTSARINELWKEANGDPNLFVRKFQDAVRAAMGGIPAYKYRDALQTIVMNLRSALNQGGGQLIINVAENDARLAITLLQSITTGAMHTTVNRAAQNLKPIYITHYVAKPIYVEEEIPVYHVQMRKEVVPSTAGNNMPMKPVYVITRQSTPLYVHMDEAVRIQNIHKRIVPTKQQLDQVLHALYIARYWPQHVIEPKLFDILDTRVRPVLVATVDSQHEKLIPVYVSAATSKQRLLYKDSVVSVANVQPLYLEALGVQSGEAVPSQDVIYVTKYIPLVVEAPHDGQTPPPPVPHKPSIGGGSIPSAPGVAFGGGSSATSPSALIGRSILFVREYVDI